MQFTVCVSDVYIHISDVNNGSRVKRIIGVKNTRTQILRTIKKKQRHPYNDELGDAQFILLRCKHTGHALNRTLLF